MTTQELEALFDTAFEMTSYEYEYARKMLYAAYNALNRGDLKTCAFEVRSFPLEVFCPTELQTWAENYKA
jgi:hypothetical protein